ncbi:MAG: ABC transporter ATP-binding protein [Anaerolineaceae bacterium]|nr:ABC transporter ATP-binding protein [Anaerolineaceae bacterium]
MSNLASLKNVTKRYKEFTLDHIDLEIMPGCVMGIIGPNGAGKTTTIKLMMNIIKPTSGEITIMGMKYPGKESEIKNRIGYVGEEQYFYEDRTVGWTGYFVSQFFTDWDENLFNKLLNRFEISRTKKVRALSKGMRVKLSFAVALSHHPKLILLDEPTSGLDPVVRRDILNMLKEISLADEHLSILISSHITEDLERIADYINYMIDGKIVLADEKDALLDQWKKVHCRAGAVDEIAIQSLRNVERNRFGCSGFTNQFAAFSAAHRPQIENGDIKVENVRLDDILISLLKG